MMRSLTSKLVLAIWLISLLGIVSVLLLARWSFAQGAMGIENRARGNVLADELGACYDSLGVWPTDVRACRLSRTSRDIRWIALDQGEDVLYRTPDVRIQQLRGRQQIVSADNQPLGTLLYQASGTSGGGRFDNNQPPSPAEPEALMTRYLIYGGFFTTGIALIAGLFLARTITRPLRNLTEATQAIAGGDLSQQVAVTSGDELGELAASFNQMTHELGESIQLRQQMTADIAHDLRTPVSVIMGHTEAVKDGIMTADDTIHIIHDQALRLNRLIDDLRTLSLADAGELQMAVRPSAILPLLKRIQAAHQPQASSQAVTLIVDTPENLPLLNIDTDRIAQVLNNLVSNSLRYTPENGQIALRARVSADSPHLILTVSDTGSGIAPEALPHIFNRFYRGDASRHGSNSGLGLAIAHSIVTQHNGTITATSTLQQGTTFTIKLPLPS